jgi:tetratricopeptide (TPR) repeat protein
MFLGSATESYEPIAWAEELIEPARAVQHPALATLYVMASQCWMPGRIEEAVRYCEAGQIVMANGGGPRPFGTEGWLGSAYLFIGQPQRWVDWCRAQLARGHDTHTLTRTCLVMALTVAGPAEEAMAAADGLVTAAETTQNPYAISFACFVHGLAFRDVDPRGALDVLRRGLVIARDSGNRFNETQTAVALSRLEAACGDLGAALEYIGLAIRRYHDAGNALNMRVAQAELAGLFHRLGRYEPAATIAGSALSPLTSSLPEFTATIADLRDRLGDQAYELLARNGEAMSTAAMATYAYEQIEQAAAELSAVSE